MAVRSELRLKRLRELLDQVERLPPSAERERMLREIRGRMVDVDTGVLPRGMLPVDAAAAEVAERVPRPARRPPARERARPRAVPRPEPATPDQVGTLGTNELLSLADSEPPAPRPDARPGRVARPWTRGLRG
jgi:hypothetical protein